MRVPDQRHLWLGNGHRGRCALTRTVNASHARRAFLQPTRAHVHAIAHLKLSAMAGCLSVKTAGHEVRANQAASVRRHFLRVGDERRWIRCPEIEVGSRQLSEHFCVTTACEILMETCPRGRAPLCRYCRQQRAACVFPERFSSVAFSLLEKREIVLGPLGASQCMCMWLLRAWVF